MNKKKSNIFIILLIVLLIILALLLGLRLFGGNPEDKVQRQLSLGDRYYGEMDYDRAIAAYTEALEIDPKNVEAKIALGDAYKARGQEYAEESAENPEQREKAVQDLEAARDYYEEALKDDSLSEKEKEDISDRKQETEDIIITIPGSPSPEPEPVPEPGPDSPEEPQEEAQISYEQYYASALQDYTEYEQYVAENTGDTHSFGEERQLNGLVSDGGDVYYRFMDLNHDGFDELIIAKNYGDDLIILDIYTRGEEGPVHVLDYRTYRWLGDRYRASFDIDNNQMMIFGSYSAFSAYAAIYQFNPNETGMIYLGRYIHDTAEKWEYGYEDGNQNLTSSTADEFSKYYEKRDAMLGDPDIFNPADWKLVREYVTEQTEKEPSGIAVGDTYIFGTYEQDNDPSNGAEDIEWIVLDKEGDRVLLLSKYALDCQPYNTTWEDVTWETCSLRKWLNGSFMDTAFSSDEAAQIVTSTVSADGNPEYDTYSGNDTEDQVFLLSISEAEAYFKSEEERICQLTTYAIERGASSGRWWWLRSPGSFSKYAAFVGGGGAVNGLGHSVASGSTSVRPALWLEP